MRALYLGGFNLPNKNAAAQRVIANAKLLRDLGYEVQLVGLGQAGGVFRFEGFDCVNFPYPKKFFQWLEYLTSIKQYLPYLENSPDIVIAYNHPAVALKRLLDYNGKRGIKTISDCTEWYEPKGGMLFRLIKSWDVNQRMYRVHLKLDGIITISRYLDDFYKEKGVRTLLLPPLVDKQESKWKNELDANDGIIRLLYAGSPAGTKDRLDFVIDALSRVASTGKEFQLDIIGITEKQYREVYQDCRQQVIPKNIHFRGRLSHEDVIKQLMQSDFQIFLREDHLANRAGFPTKFAETISAGAIVLTNASSNLKDYMLEGMNSYELDISNKDTLFDTLMKPLSLSKGEIMKKKTLIDTFLFDYRQYLGKTKAFLMSIMC